MSILTTILIAIGLPTAAFLIKLGLKVLTADRASYRQNRNLCQGSVRNVVLGGVGLNSKPTFHIKQGMAIDKGNRLVRQSTFSDEAINKVLCS